MLAFDRAQGRRWYSEVDFDQRDRLVFLIILTRICASLGLRMKSKTLFMSDHDLLLFFNMTDQFLAPGGLNAECVKVSVM